MTKPHPALSATHRPAAPPASSRIRARATAGAAVAVLAVSLGLPGTGEAHAAGREPGGTGGKLDWRRCADVAKGWDKGDKATECATVEVPLDYAKPEGRKVGIPVSRIKAGDPSKRRGVLFLNPGGPGYGGVDQPRELLGTRLADLGRSFDLIGFDNRGMGYSDKPGCAELSVDNIPEPPAGLKGKARAKFLDDAIGRGLKTCAERDEAFARSTSTATAAKDMDRVREALGEKKISYFGVSWGTALGASYRSQFDDRVDRMVLDSILAPGQSTFDIGAGSAAKERLFGRFAAWMAARDGELRLGATPDAVTRKLLALRDALEKKPRGDLTAEDLQLKLTSSRAEWASAAQALRDIAAGRTPAAPADGDAPAPKPGAGTAANGYDRPEADGDYEFNNKAYQCTDAAGDRTFETAWRQGQELKKRYPVGGYSASGTTKCSGWPLPARPAKLERGNSPLLMFAHEYETNTPLTWAKEMKKNIGGSLSVIDDDVHASLKDLDAPARAAVAFLVSGMPAAAAYEGAPVPDLPKGPAGRGR
ncbi:alpha/beta fold hydrolase [Streptomyces sp. NPDC001941]|uniref:alpha/beta fold hydrolase n=1 Tax=Streptomyces sp. NPDC001941 TaxID=3154659 RepID=UPI0033180B05